MSHEQDHVPQEGSSEGSLSWEVLILRKPSSVWDLVRGPMSCDFLIRPLLVQNEEDLWVVPVGSPEITSVSRFLAYVTLAAKKHPADNLMAKNLKMAPCLLGQEQWLDSYSIAYH